MKTRIGGMLLGAAVALVPAGAALAQETGASLGVWEKGRANLFIGNLSAFWRSQISRSADEWNDATNFEFRIRGENFEACDKYDSGVLLRPDEQTLTNGVEFSDQMCGLEDFEPGVLAVCHFIAVEGFLHQTGLVFNDFYNWDVFSGPNGDKTFDFHRVSLHELGHFLGLDHNDTEPSIVATFVSDEIDEIQPADVASVNALYVPGGIVMPEPEEPEPEPVVTCQASQLRAASQLCKAELACQAKHAKDPARDASGSKLDACNAAAGNAFTAAWDAAVAAGAGACNASGAASDMASLVDGATAGAIGLIGEGDGANADDRALRTKLLKKASALCGSAVGAWKKNALAPNETKLANTLTRARAAFASAATKAVANARAKGVSYDGANEQLIADELESLANDLGGLTGPQ
jgi:hypothetical protein